MVKSGTFPFTRWVRLAAVPVATALVLASCGTSAKSSGTAAGTSGGTAGGTSTGLTASAPGITPTQITLGVQAALTGFAGPEFVKSLPGVLARISYQNAHGGVDGRQIKLDTVDEAAAGALNTGNLAAAQSLVGKGVYGIIMLSPFTAGSAGYLHNLGVPVGGMPIASEYGEQPFTNLFGGTGSLNPHFPASTTLGQFFKDRGASVVGAVGYSVSQSSAAGAASGAASANAVGIKGVVHIQPGFGGNFLTPDALALKSQHADAVYGAMDENSNFALYKALVQAGVNVKVALFPTDIGDAIDPANAPDLQGVYFADGFLPSVIKTPATDLYNAAMTKYQPATSAVGWATEEGWLAADVFIKGLEVAGKNPTRAGFITNLRNVTDYTGGGLLPQGVNFKTDFGTSADPQCSWFLQVKGTHAVPVNTTPLCGKPIPNSNQIP